MAEAFETAVRERVAKEIAARKELENDVRRNKTVTALVENYRYELTGGHPVSLAEAFDLAAAKPSRRQCHEEYAAQKRLYWGDFAAYMAATYPDVTDLARVRKAHCESFVQLLMTKGRFVKEVSYTRPGKRRDKAVSYTRNYGVSPKTIKEIVGTCKWVFSRVMEDAGLVSNPWNGVILPAPDPVAREVFTPSELKLIWDGIQTDDFCRPLFMIAANSGLTEGDICLMQWKDFDWATGYFRTFRRKTGVRITLPLIPELIAYLSTLHRDDEYVLPDHAELYLRCPSMVSDRIKTFLNGLGIQTTVEVPGRRAVSVKDLHSMRHVFCYRAKRAGIPESVIMKFVGHAVLAMTEHYADHDTDEELRSEMKKLPPLFLGEAGDAERGVTLRRELAELAYSLPIEQVESLLAQVQRPALEA
ncbi:MAG: site-specific integrase [Lentisphaeria bacterium]|nr:site-specific integrase [Lentisphaeria bacterium]